MFDLIYTIQGFACAVLAREDDKSGNFITMNKKVDREMGDGLEECNVRGGEKEEAVIFAEVIASGTSFRSWY